MMLKDFTVITSTAGSRYRKVFIGLTLLSAALQAAAVMMLVPVLSALFSSSPASAWPWLSVQVVVVAAVWVIDGLAMRAGLRLGLMIMQEIEDAGVDAIRHLDPSDLHGTRASKIRDLVSTGGSESVSAVVLLIAPIVHSLVFVPLLSLMLLTVAWQLAAVAVLGGLLLATAFVLSRRAIGRADRAYADSSRELDDHALDFAWAQPTLRSTGVAGSALDNVLRTSRKRGLQLLMWQIPGDTLFSIALQLILLGFGGVTGWLYLNGALSGAAAAAMVVVLLRVVETVGSLSLLATPMASISRRLGEVRTLVEQRNARDGSQKPPTTNNDEPPAVGVNRVSFSYPDGTRALDGVDLTVPAGSFTVIVGGSGSGKSTLLDILAGLREPTVGEVRWNDVPTPAAQRRAGTSMMFQTTDLRPGTLRDNVMPSSGPDEAPLLASIAKQAQLNEVLAGLPDGWDSRIGEGGGTLSGGERQRVGLARALAKPAGLLLVDEATSALDAITERSVVDALGALRGKRTIIAVTHRPAMIRLADTVVVLDDASVAEHGSADELLARGGVFADLWARWRAVEKWQVHS